jgi:hypothetical protein
MSQHKAQIRNARTPRTGQNIGGQHAAPVGDSTHHHRCPYDFSIGLRNAPEQAELLAEFDVERKKLAGQHEGQPF